MVVLSSVNLVRYMNGYPNFFKDAQNYTRRRASEICEPFLLMTASLNNHIKAEMQSIVHNFSTAGTNFALTISTKKT